MSDLDFAAAFDADAHAAFAEAGLGAVSGTYTPVATGVALAAPVRGYVSRGAGALGEFRQQSIEQVEVSYLLADCTPVAGDRYEVGSDAWINVDQVANDGSLSTWAVRRG